MAASRYDESTVKIILDTIAETGSERSAWEAAKISKSCFYGWKKRHESFAIAVAKARANFIERDLNILRALALNSYYDILTKGVLKTKTTTVKEIIEVPSQKEGEPPSMKLTTVRVTMEENRSTSPPQWAIERGIGKTIEEVDAVNKLIEGGWFKPELVSELPQEIDAFNARVRNILTRNSID